jgi:uncharacterized protein (DUF433 family)
MMTATEYPHIQIDDRGRAFIKGTGFKVLQIVKDRVYYDWPAEEIQRQHPMLTLPQVYTALAYYLDHQDEFDAMLAVEEKADEDALAKRPPSDARERVKRFLAERGRG